MAKIRNKIDILKRSKKTSIGKSKNTKTYQKGGGIRGSTPSKLYKKRYRGQGK